MNSFPAYFITFLLFATAITASDEAKSVPLEDTVHYCSIMGAQNQFGNCSVASVKSDCPCTCTKSCRSERKTIANERIVDCCKVNNVEQKCKHLCTYEADPAKVQADALPCFKDVKKWLYCAAEGQDSSDCCKALGVPNICQGFCQGNLPSLKVILGKAAEYLQCLNRINDILKCQRESIPSQPGYEANHFNSATPSD